MDLSDKNNAELDLAIWTAKLERDKANKAIDLIVKEMITRREEDAAPPVNPPVEPPIDPGPVEPPIVEPPEKEVLTPPYWASGAGDTVAHKAGDTFTLKDKTVVCGGRSGVITYSLLPTIVDIDIDNVDLVQGQVTAGWGLVPNHVQGTVRNLTATGLGHPVNGSIRDGHAIYAKPQGDMTFAHIVAEDCAGQALQAATRPHEGPVPENLRISLHDFTAKDCSWQAGGHGGGGSFMLALYCASQGGTVVTAEGLRLISTRGVPEKPGSQPSTRGGLVLWKGNHPEGTADFWKFTCLDMFIDFEKGDRPPLQFQDTREVTISHIDGIMRGAWQTHEGLPLLIQMEKAPGPGHLIVERTEFPFAAKVNGVWHKVQKGGSLDLTWDAFGPLP